VSGRKCHRSPVDGYTEVVFRYNCAVTELVKTTIYEESKMKKLFGLLCAFSLFLSVPGCGGSSESTNIAEGVGQTELEKHEAMVKASTEEANAAIEEAGADPSAQ
jgi:hypothetical protein